MLPGVVGVAASCPQHPSLYTILGSADKTEQRCQGSLLVIYVVKND
jgi:hypothetical protein